MVLLEESRVSPPFQSITHAERRTIFKREYQISGRVDYTSQLFEHFAQVEDRICETWYSSYMTNDFAVLLTWRQ